MLRKKDLGNQSFHKARYLKNILWKNQFTELHQSAKLLPTVADGHPV